MSLYQIGTSPAMLFPDGDLDSQVIYNRGPSSVYLSDQSSVSPLYGVRVQPTGSVVWDAGRPLFAVCEQGYAALDVQQGSSHVLAPQVATYRRLYTFTPSATTSTPITTSIIECSSYSTILISWYVYQDIPAFSARTGETTQLIIIWYDDEGNVLGQYDQWSGNNGGALSGSPMEWRIPVQGAMMKIIATIVTTDTPFIPGPLYIAGTSHSHSPGNFPGYHCLAAVGGAGVGSVWDTATIRPDPTDTRIWIPSYGPILTIMARTTGAVTVAGTLSVFDTELGITRGYGDTLSLPVVGAAARYVQTLHVPVRRALGVLYNAPTGPQVDLTFVYSEA